MIPLLDAATRCSGFLSSEFRSSGCPPFLDNPVTSSYSDCVNISDLHTGDNLRIMVYPASINNPSWLWFVSLCIGGIQSRHDISVPHEDMSLHSAEFFQRYLEPMLTSVVNSATQKVAAPSIETPASGLSSLALLARNMTRMSVTPGPWRVTESVDDEAPNGEPNIHYGIVAGKQTERFYGVGQSYIEDEFAVVEIAYDRDYNNPVGGILNKDDAYLIAAAHELRSALESLVRITEERDNAGDMGVSRDACEMKAARAAIAKSRDVENVRVPE